MCPYSGLGVIDDSITEARLLAHCECGAYVEVVHGRITPHERGVDALWEGSEDVR